ncbi:kinase-like domain-containing protein [Pseudomassariella vexata]|uniref:Kinase-like domain-containing protein n=1 Tax=Pseudomassariella vexata TaxID=1141098 RepID=A0A1Y2DW19_9PEZI|nr:kinase-like domain-containing protein [Pseudomassariella vexata]ORY63379.1 kinase-like domain-containing protein [Pseudomassariella vexata]
MKAMRPDIRAHEWSDRDLQVMRELSRQTNHRDARFINRLIDDFIIVDHQGQHRYLIFEEPVEMSLRAFESCFPNRQLPEDTLGTITRQLLRAVRFAHGRNVVLNFSPDNVFIKTMQPIKTRARIRDLARYVCGGVEKTCPGQDLWDSAGNLRFEIRLWNLEAAHQAGTPLRTSLQATAIYPPELRIGIPVENGQSDDPPPIVDKPADIWNLAPFIFQLVTKQPLLLGRRACTFAHTDDEEANMECLAEMMALLGPIPERMRGDIWDKIYVRLDEETSKFDEPITPPSRRSLNDIFDALNHPELPVSLRPNMNLFKDFIRCMFCMDPQQRCTINELLSHRLLQGLH